MPDLAMRWHHAGTDSRHLVIVLQNGQQHVACGFAGQSGAPDLPCPVCLGSLFDATRAALPDE